MEVVRKNDFAWRPRADACQDGAGPVGVVVDSGFQPPQVDPRPTDAMHGGAHACCIPQVREGEVGIDEFEQLDGQREQDVAARR